MTIKTFNCSNKAAGYENMDMPGAFVPIPKHIRAEWINTVLASPVDDTERTTIEWLNERHCKDTETIYQLQMQLKREKERGDNIAYELVTARRMYHNENAKVINLQSENKRYTKLEDYLFQTMQVAQEQRDRRLGEMEEQS